MAQYKVTATASFSIRLLNRDRVCLYVSPHFSKRQEVFRDPNGREVQLVQEPFYFRPDTSTENVNARRESEM